MGIFSRNNGNGIAEKTYEVDGYVIGVDSHKIYHVPKIQVGSVYILPNGATGLTQAALIEMRNSKPKQIIVPSSFKNFNVEFINFENLGLIKLQEGVEEVKCIFDTGKNAVDVELPTTIKKIGKNNYPIVHHLNIPNGVVEIAPLFATHDTNLLSVNIPGTIKTIPQGAFNQCRNLQSVVFNEGVETSERDVFRGTNNLQLLEIPSTYNGIIDLPMEARPVSNKRGNSKYDGTRFKEEESSTLKIKVKRGEKAFEFDIKRGERPSISIEQNKITIKCNESQQIISIDCNTLEDGVYNVENGNLVAKQSVKQSVDSKNTPEKLDDKLEQLFQKAIRVNLEDEDFEIEGLFGSDRDKVIQYMHEAFMFQASMKIIRTDAISINKLFQDAINKLEQERNMLETPNNSNGR